MGLLSSDRVPAGISVADAYSAIRVWYQNNVARVDAYADDYGRRSSALVRALPATSTLSDVELRAVLREVLGGYLEWGYHESDGKYKMAAYAHAALEMSGIDPSLTPQEIEHLKTSDLWCHISPHFER